MRVCKGFVFLFALSLAFGAVTAEAQVSDSDFFALVPARVEILEDAPSTFTMTVYMNTKTPASAITIPLGYGGDNTTLAIDTTVIDPFGNKGVTQLAAGNSPFWTVKTSLVDPVTRTIKIGYVSFALPLPATTDSLVRIHFKNDAGGGDAIHDVDTTFIPPADHAIVITDEIAQDHVCQWTKGVVQIGTVGVGEGATPLSYDLDQNYPNPFNAQTLIQFSLARPGKVELVVFNVIGQTVKTLLNKELEAGAQSVVWDGTNDQGTLVASGTYFYRLKIGDVFEETHQMVLLK